MSALPTMQVPDAGNVLARRIFNLAPALANPLLSPPPPTYTQNRLIGRGASSGTGTCSGAGTQPEPRQLLVELLLLLLL